MRGGGDKGTRGGGEIINYQLSIINYQLSIINYQLPIPYAQINPKF